MPLASRYMIRLSFCYLILGISFGALLLINKAIDLHPMVWSLLPLHIETLFWGFIIQFTMGTAYWMLPRFLEGPDRGSPKLSVVMTILLNTGILFTIAGNLPFIDHAVTAWGRGLELFSVGIFAFLHWNRIVSYRNI